MRIPMKKNKGTALIMVLLAIAVMIIAASTIAVRFNRVFFITNNADQVQISRWYVDGIEGIIKKYMIDDFKKTKSKVYLGMNWAQPNQVIPLDDSVISGTVHDEMACFNINSLANNLSFDISSTDAMQNTDYRLLDRPYPALVFKHLIMLTGADENTADTIVDSSIDWIDNDSDMKSSVGAEDQYYSSIPSPHLTAQGYFYDKSEIRAVRGMTAEIYRRLEPLICALPTSDLNISVNMLTFKKAPLLSAVFLETMDLDTALNVINKERPEYGWDTVDGFMNNSVISKYSESVQGLDKRLQKVIVTNSNYFVANIKVSFGEHEFAFRSRFFRDADTSLVVYQRLRGELNE